MGGGEVTPIGGVEVQEKDGVYVIEDPVADYTTYTSTHPSNAERVYHFRQNGPFGPPPALTFFLQKMINFG